MVKFDKTSTRITIKPMTTSDKKMTLEKLAKMVNSGFDGVAKDLAGVKKDLTGVKEEVAGVKEEVAAVRQDFKGEISALRGEMNSEFADLRRAHNYGPELNELRERVKELERKVGAGKSN